MKRLILSIILFLIPSIANATGTALGYPSGQALTVCIPKDTNSNCGGGGSAWTLTDGTNTIANVGQVTVTGATVGGSSPNATLTITGAGGNLDGGNSLVNYIPAQQIDGGSAGVP